MLKGNLEFFPESHTYFVDGVPIPSVTTIIDKLTGLYGKIPEFVLKRAQNLGTAVHMATEYYDKGIKMNPLHPEVVPRLEAWKKFRKDYDLEFKYIEQSMYSERLWYCGTMDRCTTDTIVDVKTGKEPNGTEKAQLTAYAMMVEENTDLKINRLLIARLLPNGSYVAEEYDRIDDLFEHLRHSYSFVTKLKK